jgi:hypothetical protein
MSELKSFALLSVKKYNQQSFTHDFFLFLDEHRFSDISCSWLLKYQKHFGETIWMRKEMLNYGKSHNSSRFPFQANLLIAILRCDSRSSWSG